MWQDVLTPRETQVYAMVRLGYSNKAIATALEISVSTVCTHIEKIFIKAVVHNRRELMLK